METSPGGRGGPRGALHCAGTASPPDAGWPPDILYLTSSTNRLSPTAVREPMTCARMRPTKEIQADRTLLSSFCFFVSALSAASPASTGRSPCGLRLGRSEI